MSTTTRPTGTERRRELGAVPTDRRTQRILFATDGGLAGLSAMRWVADRARTHTLDVTVLDVVDVAEKPGWQADPKHVPADRAVHQVADYLSWAAPSVETSLSVLPGDPLTRIAGASEDADLLVVGSNRVGASRHFVASFSTRLAEQAQCPTVVVPRGWERSAGPVVVGVEGDGSDEEALAFAAREAEVLHRDLVLVHAWHLASIAAPAFAADLDRRAVEDTEASRLSAVTEQMRDRYPGLRIAPLLAHEMPVTALVRSGDGAALLVVGSHGLSVIERMMLTSVSRGVIERPLCPVAVVRSHHTED